MVISIFSIALLNLPLAGIDCLFIWLADFTILMGLGDDFVDRPSDEASRMIFEKAKSCTSSEWRKGIDHVKCAGTVFKNLNPWQAPIKVLAN